MYNYSALKNKFYPTHLRGEYEKNGMWPADCIDIDGSVFTEFTGVPPTNQMRIPGDNGLPAWGNIPPPSDEDIKADEVAEAERKKLALKAVVDTEISWRQDAVDAGIATAEEAAALAEWKKYRVLLMRVDTSKAPNIEWPPVPV